MVLTPPLLFVSGPSTSQDRDKDYGGGDGEVDSLNADDGMLDPSLTFTVTMDFVCRHPRSSSRLLPFSRACSVGRFSCQCSLFEVDTAHPLHDVANLGGLEPCQRVHQAFSCQVPSLTVLPMLPD